jgi:hypothetical protein
VCISIFIHTDHGSNPKPNIIGPNIYHFFLRMLYILLVSHVINVLFHFIEFNNNNNINNIIIINIIILV